MSVFSICLGMTLCSLTSLSVLTMFLVLGLPGLVLLRLRSLMLFGLVAVLFPVGAWFLGDVVRFPSCSAWWAFG